MKVLHVINTLGRGGAERSLAEIVLGFGDRGIDAEVAVLASSDSGVQGEVAAAGIPVHVLGTTSPVRLVPRLTRLVRDRKPDVIHTTIFESDVAGRVAGTVARRPVVSSLVNPSYDKRRSDDPRVVPWKLRAVRNAESGSARMLGAGFHAITEAVAASAVADLRIPRSKITVIPRGRDEQRLGRPSVQRRQAARQELGLDQDAFVVLNVGRCEFQKGQTTLLEAVAGGRLPENTMLVVAGRAGAETPALERLVAEHGLESRVRFLGHVDGVADLLAAADVFAFPSRFEGLGGAVLEAMALQVPVVATDIPALREVLDDGRLGLLVPVDDPAALEGAILSVHDDPAAATERAAAARQEFEDRYTLDAVTDAMAAWLGTFVRR